jgi:broad specificity phosphatase PhoE
VTRLVLARHGQTSYNAERRFQGWRDIPLDDMGRVQAQALAQALRGRSFARLLASDLVRARETAEAISQAVNVPVEVDRRLRECGFGEWQGLALAEVRERWPEEYREWVEKGTPAPGGESSRRRADRRTALSSSLERSTDCESFGGDQDAYWPLPRHRNRRMSTVSTGRGKPLRARSLANGGLAPQHPQQGS